MPVYTKKDIQENKTSKKTLPIVFLCIFSILFINLLFNLLPFINAFMLGVFGLLYYVGCVCGITFSSLAIAEKKVALPKKLILEFSLWFFFFVMIIHLATSGKFLSLSYGKYIAEGYYYKYTAGGVLFSILAYIIPYLTHVVAAYVLNSIGLVVLTALIIEYYLKEREHKAVIINKTTDDEETETQSDESESTDMEVQPQRYDNDIFVQDEVESKAESPKPDYESNKEKAKILLGLKKQSEVEIETKKPVKQAEEDDGVYNYAKAKEAGVSPSGYILTPNTYEDMTRGSRKPSKIYHDEVEVTDEQPVTQSKLKAKTLSERDAKNLEFLRASKGYYSNTDEEQSKDIYDDSLTLNDFDNNRQSYITKINNVDNAYNNVSQQVENFDKDVLQDEEISFDNFDVEEPQLSEEIEDEYVAPQEEKVKSIDEYISSTNVEKQDDYKPKFTASPYTMESKDDEIVEAKSVEQVEIIPIKETPKPKPKYRKPSKYIRPPLDLLRTIPQDDMQVTEKEEEKGRMIEEVLANFKIPANISNIIKGPAFTRYELTIPAGQGIPVRRVGQYADDIAMAIQSKGKLRLLLPVAGKNAFGVEVPNESVSAVGLKELLESRNYQKSTHPLTFALGKDITNECIVSNLEKCIHILLAGTTGSGKSVCAHTILLSLMYKTSPDELKFLLIDPKKVEFTKYANLPHMLIPKAINDPQKAVDALDWVCREMDQRYQLFSNAGVRKIDEYNLTPEVQSGMVEKMYYLVVVVDELSDLMQRASKEVESKIIRISQLARAAGIHLIISTQRPSADVITGTIKSNLPTKIALAVNNGVNSRIIIDELGAENLLGRGDMLFSLQGAELQRIQGAYVSDEEIDKIVNFIKDNNEAYFDDTIEDAMFNKNNNGGFNAEGPGSSEGFDPLLKDCVRNAIKSQNVSASKYQRMYSIGWNRAAKIVDQMVAAGFISEPDDRHKYTIFITEQEFEETFGEDFE